MNHEKLKKAIEELSEEDLNRIRILKNISKKVEDTTIEEINKMPLLYRLELRKALEEMGDEEKARKINT